MVSGTVESVFAGEATALQNALRIAESVVDPELPFMTLKDLGILRSVKIDQSVVIAEVSPTYSGCPAVTVIEDAVYSALTDAGYEARVERVLSPPWSTDFITEEGRAKLQLNGISPPVRSQGNNEYAALFTERLVRCPLCSSEATEKISEFGSTPCKAQYRCKECLEPFDYFKCH